MARPPEAVRGRGIGRQLAAGECPVVGGDSGRDQRGGGVDGDGVGGSLGVLVGGHHLRELEGRRARGEERRADETGGVPDHEGHLLRGHGFRGDDQVGFVFAVGVVEDYYELAISEGFNCVWD